jgi:hypothetical protein
MNYQNLLERSKESGESLLCKHGLQKEVCGFCNHFVEERKNRRSKELVDVELYNQYEKLKEQFRNFREIWTEDEFFAVFSNIKDVRGTKEEINAIYRTSIELSRTKGAVRWAMEHLFSQKEYHRGKVVKEFRTLFGLDKT